MPDIPKPETDLQFVVYALAAIPILIIYVYFKYGKKKYEQAKPNISDCRKHAELLSGDNERLKSLERGHRDQWEAIYKIETYQRQFAEKVLEKLGQIHGKLDK